METEPICFVELKELSTSKLQQIFLTNHVQQPIRIELQFSGCCDPSLGLRVDCLLTSDLEREIEGLHFVIDFNTFQMTGRVIIHSSKCHEKDEFIVTSEHPVSEWDGLGSCRLKL